MRMLCIGSALVFGSLQRALDPHGLSLEHAGETLREGSASFQDQNHDIALIIELSASVFDHTELPTSLVAGVLVSDESASLAAQWGITPTLSSPEELLAWWKEVSEHEAVPSSEKQHGRIISVMGAGGSPGSTTVAIAAAFLLADAGGHVMLLDADTYGPSIALLLGLVPEQSGLVSALRLARRPDADIQDVLQKGELVRTGRSSVAVFTGIAGPESVLSLEPGLLRALLGVAVASHHTVVVDLASPVERFLHEVTGGLIRNGATREVLGLSHHVVVVTRPTLLHTERLVERWPRLLSLAPVAEISVVINAVSEKERPLVEQTREALWNLASIRDPHILPWASPLLEKGVRGLSTQTAFTDALSEALGLPRTSERKTRGGGEVRKARKIPRMFAIPKAITLRR